MRTAPREIWVVYAAYVLENIAYGLGASTVVSLWLSWDFGFSDVRAGNIVTAYSIVLTLVTVLVGSLTDAAGIRRTFLLGFWVCLVSRLIMMAAGVPAVALPFGLFLQAVGIALMGPVMIAAMKRYSTTRQRSMAFALYYALQNVGFATAGYLFDATRNKLGEHGSLVIPIWGESLSTYRVLILCSALVTIPGLVITWFFLRDGVEVTDDGVVIAKPKTGPVREPNPFIALARTIRETAVKTTQIFISLWREPSLYRFLVFMLLVVFVKLIGYHMSFTFPKFGLRELGEGAPIGRLYGVLNAVLIVILVPICGALTSRFTAYRMVTIGTLIAASSVFLLAIPAHWFKPLADGWLGDLIAHRWLGISGTVNPWYVSICLFVVLLSIGEALWSPRLYEYAAAIAPKGQEASYMAMSVLPYFGAKFGVGILSGMMLKRYCPATGPRDSATMWLLIGCMALITPVGIFLLRRFIQVQEAGREPETARH
ncbi:MAG TPA: MFS transporter [Candidatus Paceibacterota bacterium]|nr:MFS transporter [Candidatus Paceibacterota bacterium]